MWQEKVQLHAGKEEGGVVPVATTSGMMRESTKRVKAARRLAHGDSAANARPGQAQAGTRLFTQSLPRL
ncbi:hypothetical protein DIPPA_06114 [Diplonema papillatum]|nr:hypothetical protein DIPPA_06114 [Diplonema papillatum]